MIQPKFEIVRNLNKSVHLLIDGVTTELPLVTSVAYFKSAYFERTTKWKVFEDESFARTLIEAAQANPCLATFKALIGLEKLYFEIRGVCGASSEDRSAARKDLMNEGSRYSPSDDASRIDYEESGSSSEGNQTHIIDIYNEPLGNIIERRRRLVGINRNSWRKNKPKKK